MTPRMLVADSAGNITEDRHLLMLCASAGRWRLPQSAELAPLPPESELFLLPGRRAAGYDSKTGKIRISEKNAVAAFAAPGYTLRAHPAYKQDESAPMLPLFAYGAVGYANGKFWIAAKKVDSDPRQQFGQIKRARIEREAWALLRQYPRNRLVSHIINNCVRRYDCPAARNFALGRYEAPLPTSRACNARCLGCISLQAKDSPIATTPQCRLEFTPEPGEIAEVMAIHASRERRAPIYSFGQGCEGDPLVNPELLAESIRLFRAGGGQGTINCNTNASNPEAVAKLAQAGLTSLRASLNSAQPDLYAAYYSPQNYGFEDVKESIRVARRAGVYVSLNLLYFPGITDTREELASLGELCGLGVGMIQLRNLNIDPQWYASKLAADCGREWPQALGLDMFMDELKRACPWLEFGYFNPWLGEKARIAAPMPL